MARFLPCEVLFFYNIVAGMVVENIDCVGAVMFSLPKGCGKDETGMDGLSFPVYLWQ